MLHYICAMNVTIRHITAADNPLIAGIIRSSLTEYGLNQPGTVYYDASTDHLYELFQTERSVYYVAEYENKIIGGAGIYPSNGLPEGVCELSKMYVLQAQRGQGVGKALLHRCIDFAAAAGYKKMYLESMPELTGAISLYGRYGFEHLKAPLGNTGHYFCTVWMQKQL